MTARRLAATFLLTAALCVSAPAAAEVPFVGCASDGQVGLIPPPARAEVDHVPGSAPSGLAYYATQSAGALAPRGWSCFAVHGSNGERLVIAPGAIGFEQIAGSEAALLGPAVELSHEYGFTSGRYAVAAMIARFFPAHRAFVREVEASEIPLDPLPGPWPKDEVLPMGDDAIAFRTPAGEEGLGTADALSPDEEAVVGLVLILPGEDMSMKTLSVRLPGKDAALVPAILESAAAARGLTLPAGFPAPAASR